MTGFWSEGFFFPNPGCGPTVRPHLKRTKAQWALHALSFLPEFSQDRGDRTLRLSQKVQDKDSGKTTLPHTHMERDARTRNGTSNSLHIDVANCNLCYASHCKLKSCSMHFDKNRTDIIRLHIKEKQSQQPLPRDTGNSPLPRHQETKRNPHKLSPHEVINHTSCTYWSICAQGVNISRCSQTHRRMCASHSSSSVLLNFCAT